MKNRTEQGAKKVISYQNEYIKTHYKKFHATLKPEEMSELRKIQKRDKLTNIEVLRKFIIANKAK